MLGPAVVREILPGIATPGWFGAPRGAVGDQSSGVSIIYELSGWVKMNII